MDVTGAPAPAQGAEVVPNVPRYSDNAPAWASKAAPVDGVPVRVESAYLESGWIEGKIGPSPSGCRMVFLSKPNEAGYASVALMTLQRVQRKDGDSWQDMPVQPLLDREPAHCLEAAAD